MTFWAAQAYLLIPLGALLLLLLLSNRTMLKGIAKSVLDYQISFGRVSTTLGVLLAALTFIVFSTQSFTLISMNKTHTNQTTASQDRALMRSWRVERNWWIALFSSTLWLFTWRISAKSY
jgi:hypothetical protein